MESVHQFDGKLERESSTVKRLHVFTLSFALAGRRLAVSLDWHARIPQPSLPLLWKNRNRASTWKHVGKRYAISNGLRNVVHQIHRWKVLGNVPRDFAINFVPSEVIVNNRRQSVTFCPKETITLLMVLTQFHGEICRSN